MSKDILKAAVVVLANVRFVDKGLWQILFYVTKNGLYLRFLQLVLA